MFALYLLLACGGEPPALPAAAPTPPPPAPVAVPEAVGPDGPASLAIPTLAAVATDAATVTAGEAVFAAKGCGACHKFGAKLVGPDLKGVFERRTIPWVERMVLHPDAMIKADPTAKKLFGELMTPMPDQGVSDAELPSLLAYLKAQGG